LKDEDSLFNFLRTRFLKDPICSSLFEFVRFGYLPCESMQLFITIIDESFDILTIGLWISICRRLSLSVSPTHQNDRLAESSLSTVHNCPFADGSPLEGVISDLTRNCGVQIGDRGIVSISANSINSPTSHPLRNIADFENQSCFFTNNEVNSWICYDFKNMRIKPTHYSIRSRCDYNSHYLCSWMLEGSIDGQSWQELDRRENNTALNSQGATATFSISQSSDIQMIRFR
jgi:hypothetical protein